MESTDTPGSKASNSTDQLIIQSLAKLDAIALGIALGILSGLLVFIATVFLIIKGGDQIGPNLALLGQYFIGYEVTVPGSFIGLLYGMLFGFLGGWLIAKLRNVFVSAYVTVFRLKRNMSAVNDFLDNP